MAFLLAVPVRAQDVATSFEDLRDRIKLGETIYITDIRGATSKDKTTIYVGGARQRLSRMRVSATPLRGAVVQISVEF